MMAPLAATGDQHALRAFPPRRFSIARANGTTVWTTDGRQINDLGGISHGAALIGHNHPAVTRAIRHQAADVVHVSPQTPNPARDRFLAALHRFLPDQLTHTFLANSGTEAIEAAVKLAMTSTGRSRFIAAEGGFHGRSLGALSLTHRAAFRQPFTDRLGATDFVPLNDLDALTDALGDDVAAVVLEPVQGEGGVRGADPSYLRAARDLAHRAGALLILDEVQTGLGRTGTFLAAESAGVTPDILTLGKGLAGGLPVGACSVSRAVAAALPAGGHGSTYGGSPLVCAAGAATLQTIESEQLVSAAARRGSWLLQRLRSLEAPAIQEVRGHGMMIAIDLRCRTAPIAAALEVAGFSVLTSGSRTLRLLPPLTCDEDVLDHFSDALAWNLPGGKP